MRWFFIVVICSFAFAQEPKDDPVAALLKRIEGLASAEPAIFALDTRIRMAEMLAATRPGVAHKVLDRTLPLLAAIRDDDSRATFQARIVQHMASLDLDAAETLAANMPPAGERDYAAFAYDAIIRVRHSDTTALIDRALAHGAFTLDAVNESLTSLEKSNPPEAQALFAKVLAFYPPLPRLEDARYLLSAARHIGAVNRFLEIEAIEKVLDLGKISPAYEKPGERKTFLIDAVARLRALDPEVYERYRDRLQSLASAADPIPAPTKAKDSADDYVPPDDLGLTFSEALSRARKIERDLIRASVLIELSRRQDATPRQQGMVADEALSAMTKLPPNEDRMVGLSMLTHDFAKRKDHLHARLAARHLADTFDVVCGCEDSKCETLKGREHCAANIQDFAEYLDEEKISPENLGIENVSLTTRTLLIELARLVHFKPWSVTDGSIFPNVIKPEILHTLTPEAAHLF